MADTTTISNTPTPALTVADIEKAKPRKFTLGTARSGLDRIKPGSKGAQRLAAEYSAGVLEFVRNLDGSKMVAVAYAIEANYRAGMTRNESAKMFGYSGSYVTLSRRLSQALVKGIEAGSDEWRLLSSKAAANVPAVAKVIEAKDTTADDIRSALKSEVYPLGHKQAGKAKQAEPESGTESDTESNGGGNGGNGADGNGGSTVDLPRGFDQRMATVEAIIAGLPASPSKAQKARLATVLASLAAYAVEHKIERPSKA